MKKSLLALTLVLGTGLAQANPHHGHGHRGGHGHHWGGWVAPLVVGGAIGYGLSRQYYQPVYATPVIVEQPVITQPQMLIQPPIGYRWQQMIDPSCNCNKIVLVPN
jgi:hypothetical protein